MNRSRRHYLLGEHRLGITFVTVVTRPFPLPIAAQGLTQAIVDESHIGRETPVFAKRQTLSAIGNMIAGLYCRSSDKQ